MNASSVSGRYCVKPTSTMFRLNRSVYEEMNKAFGRDVCYVTTIGLSQIAAAQNAACI